MDWSHHFICGASLPFCPLGLPQKACTTLLWGPEGCDDCEVNGVWTCWPGPLWKITSSSEEFEENELLDTWHLVVCRSSCRCVNLDLPSKLPLSSELSLLVAPASWLLLSQTISDDRFRDRNLAVLRTLITACFLSNEHSVRLFIMHLKRGHVVKRHIFQLYKARCCTDQSVYFYKSDFSWNYNLVWSSATRHLNFSIRVGKSVTSQCGE